MSHLDHHRGFPTKIIGRMNWIQKSLEEAKIPNETFSKNSKVMNRELGNVELFELCETIPKVQCSHCLLHWNQGIVYCTCGQYLVDGESRRKCNKLRLDALSIPNYVIKKGRCHGARHCKTEEQKRVPYGLECVEEMLPKEDHTYRLTPEEKRRYQWECYLTLNISGKNGPMKLRSDFRAAVSMKNRLHQESGEQIEEPGSPEEYSIWHPSSSTWWWDKSEWNWKWAQRDF